MAVTGEMMKDDRVASGIIPVYFAFEFEFPVDLIIGFYLSTRKAVKNSGQWHASSSNSFRASTCVERNMIDLARS